MGDFFDEDDDPNYSRREKLQEQLYVMQNMLEQLNEAKASMDSPVHDRGHGFRQDSRRHGRGGGGRGNFGRGLARKQGGGRGPGGRGGGGRGPGGRGYGGNERGRQHFHSPQVNSDKFRELEGAHFGEQRSYNSPSRGRGLPVHSFQQGRENSFDYQSISRQRIRPQFLVETLAAYPDLSCSLIHLFEQKNMQPSAVREVVSTLPNVFSLRDEIVELKPQIRICANHCGTDGCLDPSCDELHICDQYIMERCRDRNCVLGHRWRTGHNDPILHNFYIKQLPFPTLLRLLQKTRKYFIKSTEPLDLCLEYNGKGCRKRNCEALHLCLSFVSKLTKCNNSKCKLNHDPLERSCLHLLEKHGFATNESPRDIIVALVSSNPSLRKENSCKDSQKQKGRGYSKSLRNEDSVKDSPDFDQKEHTSKTLGKRKSHKKAEMSSSQSSGSDASPSDTDSETDSQSSHDNQECLEQDESFKKSPAKLRHAKSPEAATKSLAVAKPQIQRTFWSHYLLGDVPIPEICYYSVESSCRYEGSGCQRLHATKHFHWQIHDQSNRWFNLRPEQIECLELSYCDPAKDSVELPRLDPATLEYSVSGLFSLMGREKWISDFKTMTLTNASKSKAFKIQRLCTQMIEGEVIKPSLCLWYFSDKNGEWVQYGSVDTVGATDLVSNITSDDIEKQFCKDPTSSIPFQNSQFQYILDFKTMTQKNLNTSVSRKVIRRPMPHIQDEKKEEAKDSNDLPDTWEKMQPEERMRLVSIAPSSSEYQGVVSLLSGSISSSNVMKVQRIQNPFLWRALENKIKEMTTIYKDAAQVNVRQLFHGTDHNIVPNICAENFDWRLHGTKSGQSYGRGTYFAANANYSYGYAHPDSNNMRHMFIARVAVGSVTSGNSSMVRPPINPLTLQPFDSTVDNISSPSIIVKYDKQEYYPEYLLTLT